MAAAAHGVSTLGIPKKVGQEFSKADKGKTFDQATLAPNAAVAAGVIRSSKTAKDMKPTDWSGLIRGLIKFFAEEAKEKEHANDAKPLAAGTMFQAADGSVLLLKRGGVEGKDNFVGHWALPGGGAEPGETAEQAARREAVEEMGDHPDGPRELLSEIDTPNGMKFSTFRQKVADKFTPKLNSEHTDHIWATKDSLPTPIHPAVAKLLEQHLGPRQAADSACVIAMDRDTIREKTRDGRLTVDKVNVTKANICPYRGEEIPGWQELGLDPNTVYNLLRDPEELKKAAPTLNGVQLLKKHTPVSAADPHQDKTVGSLGTDAEWDGEYLTNSLFVNTQDAIDGIESGAQRELSAGYHYKPDMTPGIFNGKRYDGVMRDIVFNHVALVEDGRVGADCAA